MITYKGYASIISFLFQKKKKMIYSKLGEYIQKRIKYFCKCKGIKIIDRLMSLFIFL